jgi:hypothetical protein
MHQFITEYSNCITNNGQFNITSDGVSQIGLNMADATCAPVYNSLN